MRPTIKDLGDLLREFGISLSWCPRELQYEVRYRGEGESFYFSSLEEVYFFLTDEMV